MAEPETQGGPSARRGSLVDVAYDSLLGWILDGTLEPGEAVRISKVAQSLEVSPTPLREALARLEGQGLVLRLPMRGFRVAEPMTRADFLELTRAREVLEPELAALAAASIRPAGVVAMQRVLARTDQPGGGNFAGYRRYLEASADFHAVVADLAGNRFLRDALNVLPVHVQRFRLFGDRGVDDREISFAEHAAVADAIGAGDVDAARAAMLLHVRAVADRAEDTPGA